MTPQRSAAMVFAGGLLALWLAAAAGPYEPQGATHARQSGSAAGDPLFAEVQKQADRLRQRLTQQPAPPVDGRNPFRFGPPPVRVAPQRVPALEPQPEPIVEAPAPELRPQLNLVGIGEDRGEAGPVRTAIISGLGNLFVVEQGGELGGRFRVVAIGADAVELLDLTDNTTFRLGLK